MLFDEEDQIEDNESELNIDVTENVLKTDKIFNNDFNSGNIDFEEFSLPTVSVSYSENYSDAYNSLEYNRLKKLEELVDMYFKESKYNNILECKQKIPKQIIPFLYESIRIRFINYEYTNTEIFSSITEYFNFTYEYLYDNIPSVYKEQLIKELDDKYDILKKRGMKKLF